MATDTQILKNRQQGQAATYNMSSDSAPAVEIAKLHSFLVSVDKAADDATAATATAETYSGRDTPYQARVKSVRYTATTGGITADNTNNATITVYVRDVNGATQTAIATLTTNLALGNVVQGAKTLFTLTLANVIVAADSTFTYAITKGGTGVVVRAGTIRVELEKV